MIATSRCASMLFERWKSLINKLPWDELFCISFQLFKPFGVEPLGDNRIYIFPKIGIGHTRFATFGCKVTAFFELCKVVMWFMRFIWFFLARYSLGVKDFLFSIAQPIIPMFALRVCAAHLLLQMFVGDYALCISRLCLSICPDTALHGNRLAYLVLQTGMVSRVVFLT